MTPNIPVKPPLLLGDLTGPEGNAYAILGAAHEAIKDAERQGLTFPGGGDAYWGEFHDKATSSDYDNLLRTVDKYFTVVTRISRIRPASAVELARHE